LKQILAYPVDILIPCYNQNLQVVVLNTFCSNIKSREHSLPTRSSEIQIIQQDKAHVVVIEWPVWDFHATRLSELIWLK